MRRLMQITLAILAVCALLFFGSKQLESAQGLTEGNTLRIYNWGDYIDPDLIAQFEEETGYAVSYETFDSNEAMYTKIKQGGTAYDIAVPSEYMIEKLMSEDLLVELDRSKIQGFENLGSQFVDLPFDEGNRFSIPYFWGTLGIIYNTNQVEEGAITSWADLWKPEFNNQILFIDGAREVMGIGLQKNHLSLNEKNPAILRDVAEELKLLMPNAKALLADEIKVYMAQGEAPIAVTYSGEAADMMWENEDLGYVIPTEGSNLWFDNMVIPKTASNLDAAYAFINFMLRPEVAAQNADYIGYSTPNTAAMELMDEEVVSDTNFYPTEDMLSHMEVYEALDGGVLELYNDLYLEIKMAR